MVQRPGIPRGLAQDPLEGPAGRGEAAELEEGDAALVLRVHVARIAGHRLLEVEEGLPVVPQVVLGHPGEHEQARRERRVGAGAGDRARGSTQGQVEPRLQRVAVAEAGHVEVGGDEEGGRVVGVGGQQPGESGPGVGVAVERRQGDRPLPQRGPVARVDLERLLGAGQRHLGVTGLPGAGRGLRELAGRRAVAAGEAGARRRTGLGERVDGCRRGAAVGALLVDGPLRSARRAGGEEEQGCERRPQGDHRSFPRGASRAGPKGARSTGVGSPRTAALTASAVTGVSSTPFR